MKQISTIDRFELPNLATTEWLGARLALMLQKGDLILLTGSLGAGKTTLARSVIRTALRDPTHEVPSPTFTLVQVYEPEKSHYFSIWHCDLYRVHQTKAVDALALEEGLAEGAVLVEWPDRLNQASFRAAILHLTLHFADSGSDSGHFVDSGSDSDWENQPRIAFLEYVVDSSWAYRLKEFGLT